MVNIGHIESRRPEPSTLQGKSCSQCLTTGALHGFCGCWRVAAEVSQSRFGAQLQQPRAKLIMPGLQMNLLPASSLPCNTLVGHAIRRKSSLARPFCIMIEAYTVLNRSYAKQSHSLLQIGIVTSMWLGSSKKERPRF